MTKPFRESPHGPLYKTHPNLLIQYMQVPAEPRPHGNRFHLIHTVVYGRRRIKFTVILGSSMPGNGACCLPAISNKINTTLKHKYTNKTLDRSKDTKKTLKTLKILPPVPTEQRFNELRVN